MGRPALELADIFRLHGPAYREAYRGMINSMQRRVMRAIEVCRTAVLGGHVEKCDHCGHRRIPFGGPEQVLDYLGRYTHRVAISNDRLIRLDNGKVTFRWKDYQAGNRQKHMTLDAEEFLRRFLMHVLPAGFVRIRHYGWLANAQRRYKLALCRELLGVEQPAKEQQASAETLGEAGTGLKLASFMICPVVAKGAWS
jgi:Putative transposase/Transposase zinc-binding domain